MMPATARERRGRRTTIAAALMLALVPSAGGCSYFRMRPAPPPSAWPDPVLPSSSEERCTASFAPPIADTVIGGTLGWISYRERNSGSPDIAVAIGVASVPYLVSAVYGYFNSVRCHRYQALFRP